MDVSRCSRRWYLGGMYLLLRRDTATAALHGLGERGNVKRRRILDRVVIVLLQGRSTPGRSLDGCGQRPGVRQLVQDRVEQVVQELVHVRRLRRHAHASDMGRWKSRKTV